MLCRPMGKPLLKGFLCLILVWQIAAAPTQEGSDNVQDQNQYTTQKTDDQGNNQKPLQTGGYVQDSDPNLKASESSNNDEKIDEEAEKSILANQKRNIQRYKDLQGPAEIEGVPLVKVEKQAPAKQGQKTAGTTAHLDVGDIVQDKVQKFLSRNNSGADKNKDSN